MHCIMKGKIKMTKTELFAQQLHNGTREFFLRMNEILVREGLVIRHGDKRVTNRITYFPDTNRKNPLELKKLQPLVLRYTLDNDGELTVELKLNLGQDTDRGLLRKSWRKNLYKSRSRLLKRNSVSNK